MDQNDYCFFINCNTLRTQLLPQVIILPLHNKQDSGHIGGVVRDHSLAFPCDYLCKINFVCGGKRKIHAVWTVTKAPPTRAKEM